MADALLDTVAIVTGASRGIGRAISLQLAAEGATVVAAARSARELEALVEAIRAAGGTAVWRTTDVRDSAQCRALVDWTVAELGKLDILVNNAGLGYWAPVADVTDAQWQETVEVNLNGVFYLTQAALGPMRRAGRGRIVNISSGMARSGRRVVGMAPYSATKAAVSAFSETLAKEVRAEGIKVSVLLPAAVSTNFRDTHVNRPMEPRLTDPALQLRPEDVASAVLWALTTSAHVGPMEMLLEAKEV